MDPKPTPAPAAACPPGREPGLNKLEIRNSHADTEQTPVYWMPRQRAVSNISYTSVSSQHGQAPITLEDHTESPTEASSGLWAKSVTIDDYVVVSGSHAGAGSYVVWNCTLETLEGTTLKIRKRYSDFDNLRNRLVQTFPHSAAAMPPLPRKSVISKFRQPFLEKRRQGLAFFFNCVILNPEFASSPVLKEFLFS